MILVASNGEIGVPGRWATCCRLRIFCYMLKQAPLMPRDAPSTGKHKLSPFPNGDIACLKVKTKIQRNGENIHKNKKVPGYFFIISFHSLLMANVIPLAQKLILGGRNGWSCCGDVQWEMHPAVLPAATRPGQASPAAAATSCFSGSEAVLEKHW